MKIPTNPGEVAASLTDRASNTFQQVAELGWGLGLMAKAGIVAPMRPDRAIGVAGGYLRWGLSMATGYAAGASRHPDRPAVIDDRGVLTFAEVHERTDRLAAALADRDVDGDTSIAVLCRNHRGPLEVAVAAAKLGANVALLNTSLSANTIDEVLREQKCDVLVADSEFSDALDELPSGCRLIIAWADDRSDGDEDTVEALIESGGDSSLPLRPPHGKLIVLTSGTTGTPKGAERPRPKSWAPAGAILSRIPFQAGDPMFIAPPLFHTWGFAALQLAMLLGAPAVLRRKFEPADALRTMAEHRCGTLIAVPVMLSRLLELPEDEAARFDWRPRVVAVSGSALPGDLATKFMDRFGDVLYNLYGSTEVSWVSIADPTDLRVDPSTAGKAPFGTKLAILDDDGNPVEPGEIGRVFVSNGMMFEGYTREGHEVETQDGMMTTGDLGRLDEDGRLFLSGRGDSMIVSGGENVYPGPVEDLLASTDEVREVAVVGVDDEKFGQRLAAYVVLNDGASLDADKVRSMVKEKLSRFSVPRDVVFLDELPRNPTGKVLARELPEPDESDSSSRTDSSSKTGSSSRSSGAGSSSKSSGTGSSSKSSGAGSSSKSSGTGSSSRSSRSSSAGSSSRSSGSGSTRRSSSSGKAGSSTSGSGGSGSSSNSSSTGSSSKSSSTGSSSRSGGSTSSSRSARSSGSAKSSGSDDSEKSGKDG